MAAKSLALDEMQESPEIAGLLYKRRGGFGKIMPNAWQYRFFVITRDGVLLYFDTAEEGHSESKARGRVDLRAIIYELSMEPIEGAPTPYFIQIAIPNEEKWKLCAETKEDQGRWYNVLEKYSKVVKSAPSTNYMSDDEAGADKGSLTRRGSSSFSPRAADAKTLNPTMGFHPITIPANPSDGKQRVPTPVPAAAPAPSAVPAAASSASSSTAAVKHTHHHKKRGGLKSAKATSAESAAYWEVVMVLLIVNICFMGIYRAQSLPLIAAYFTVGNMVVYHTLQLRGSRATNAAHAAAASAAATAAALAKAAAAADVVSPTATTSRAVPVEAAAYADAAEMTTSLSLDTSSRKGGKPIAGATFPEVEMLSDGKEGAMHTWCKTDPRLFNVRIGPDYNRNKKKAPSAFSIYEPVGFDIFCTKKRVDHCAQRFVLPDTSGIDTHHPHVPPLLVIQVQIPSEPPASIFSSAEDGPGWALVTYYRITEESCKQLADLSTASPAIKLFAEWCEKAPTDAAWRGRFKVICLCTNFEELGFPSMITAYNGKPVLIRRTGTIFTGPGYLEMNIHVHKFANMAKQSIYLLTSRCNTMNMNIGFVIEGREDKELPEALFACVAVNRPQEEQAEFLFDEE